MKFFLWLDDIRPCPYMKEDEVAYINEDAFYRWAHSVYGAIKYLTLAEEDDNDYDEYIFDLDHDLGDYFQYGGDAIEFVKWLIETGRTTKKYRLKFHTMNPVGRDNMLALYKRYWEV